jgi:hypothetical protein
MQGTGDTGLFRRLRFVDVLPDDCDRCPLHRRLEDIREWTRAEFSLRALPGGVEGRLGSTVGGRSGRVRRAEWTTVRHCQSEQPGGAARTNRRVLVRRTNHLASDPPLLPVGRWPVRSRARPGRDGRARPGPVTGRWSVKPSRATPYSATLGDGSLLCAVLFVSALVGAGTLLTRRD